MVTEPGEGKGVGKPERRAGGADKCVCPTTDCNYTVGHERGTPCNTIICPRCGSRLIGE